MLDGIVVGNNPILFVDPWGLCDNLAARIWNDATYSIGQAANAVTDLAVNGPAPARALLGFAAATEVVPIATYGLVNGGAAVATAVTTQVLTNPQGTLDFVTSMFPGTTPTMNWSGVYGATIGKILGTDKW